MRAQISTQPERRHAWSAATGSYAPAPEKSAGFIKGPLPLVWVQQAASMPGKTLQVGLTLWYLSGLQKSPTVRLASKPLEAMPPGATVLTRTPTAARSRAIGRVMPTTPPFDDEYAA